MACKTSFILYSFLTHIRHLSLFYVSFQRGDIKIFDFGLARELISSDANADGTFNLSHMMGMLHYMAPKVYVRGTPYNTSCDTYSFAILLWQMLVLERPFDDLDDEETFVQEVFVKNTRPTLNRKQIRSLECHELLCQAWDPNPRNRPSMEDIGQVLRKVTYASELGDDDLNYDPKRRRSTFVFLHSNGKDPSNATKLSKEMFSDIADPSEVSWNL